MGSSPGDHPGTPTGYPGPQNLWAQDTAGTTYVSPDLRAQSWTAAQAALGTATAIHAALADSGALQTVTTAITQPTCARNVTATPSGTTANVTAVQMIVNGTDLAGNVIQEILPAFTAGAATAVVGSKAFATVTSYLQPACGASVSISLGTGAKLGLQDLLPENSVLYAALAGVREATAPTVTVSSTVLSSNTMTLNSALNGTAVTCKYIV